jgi:2Fe-2S ferredoxin
MPYIKILSHSEICPESKKIMVKEGDNLCQVLLDNGIDIEHACDMSCACTTCHVVVRDGFDSLNEAAEREDDLLDMAWGLTQYSRLSCQVKIGTKDIVLEIPKYTINHAKEG